MSSMWEEWASRRRLVGVVFLGGAAVAIAVAVVLFLTSAWAFVTVPAVTALTLTIHAGFEFIDAHRYARLAR